MLSAGAVEIAAVGNVADHRVAPHDRLEPVAVGRGHDVGGRQPFGVGDLRVAAADVQSLLGRKGARSQHQLQLGAAVGVGGLRQDLLDRPRTADVAQMLDAQARNVHRPAPSGRGGGEHGDGSPPEDAAFRRAPPAAIKVASTAVQRLWTYVGRHRGRYIAGAACLFATATLVMAIPYLTRRAIDTIRAGDSGVLDAVAWYGSAIVVLAVLQALVRTLSRVLIFNTGRDIEYEIRSDLFRHLETLPQSFYQRQRTGDLMSRLVNDIAAIRLMLGPGILTIINTPLYCVYAFSLMLAMNVRLTLAAVVPFPLLLWIVKRYSGAMMEATVRTQERLADLSSYVQEHLSGIHVVRAYVREKARIDAFAELNEAFKDQAMEVAKLRGMVFPFVRIVSSLGVLIVLYYGGLLVVAGSLTLGELVAFIGYLHILAWPIMAMGWMIAIYQRSKAALTRLGEIFDTRPEIVSPPQPQAAGAVRGEIRFEGVRFAYPSDNGGPLVLDGVDLTIPAGGRLGVIGRTGSGKSTLALLIPRLFDVSEGRVTVDGVDVRDWDLRALRSHIGFVPQDPFLFSSSIEENIEFARDDASGADLARLVEMAGLDADLAEFPQGLETQVGERGVTLSGGQKQRLTLARAIARDPSILILDDSLSSVDAATERRILEQLEEVLAGRTSIVISHRVSSVRRADQIAVVDGGRIVERGTHEQLVALGGVYADLYQRQRISEELEAM
ncbi:MAG: ABC transporter ATP-binding protein [Candidatus Dadabacteria bacterium]|nr:MAG: ABC transporter ATP-binding protein [Candidatus Dadabacteria bacterium]